MALARAATLTSSVIQRSITSSYSFSGILAKRCSGTHEPSIVDPHKGKVASDDVQMPDSLGHSVGKERYELLCKLYGWDDPYLMKPICEGKGTYDDPFIAWTWPDTPTRVVQCYCVNTGFEHLKSHHLNLGVPKRCECGYWFYLQTGKSPPFLKDFQWSGAQTGEEEHH